MDKAEAKRVLDIYEAAYTECKTVVTENGRAMQVPDPGKRVFSRDQYCEKVKQFIAEKPASKCSDEEKEAAAEKFFHKETGELICRFIREEPFDEKAENSEPFQGVRVVHESFDCDLYFHAWDLYLIRQAMRVLNLRPALTSLVKPEGETRPISDEDQAFLSAL